MARAKSASSATIGFEAKLWLAAKVTSLRSGESSVADASADTL